MEFGPNGHGRVPTQLSLNGDDDPEMVYEDGDVESVSPSNRRRKRSYLAPLPGDPLEGLVSSRPPLSPGLGSPGNSMTATAPPSSIFDILMQKCLTSLTLHAFIKYKKSTYNRFFIRNINEQFNKVDPDDFEYMEALGQGKEDFLCLVCLYHHFFYHVLLY